MRLELHRGAIALSDAESACCGKMCFEILAIGLMGLKGRWL